MTGRDLTWLGLGALISTLAGLLTRVVLNHSIAYKEHR